MFDIFTIPLIQGESKTVLSQPNSIVISEKMVQKYFGNDDPIGKILTFNSTTDYKVTGIFREIPGNSHFHFDFFASLTTLPDSRDQGWLNNMSFRTYLILKDSSSPRDLEAKFPAMVKKYIAPRLVKNDDRSFEEMTRSGLRLHYYLQPVTDIHLYSDLDEEFEPNGDIKYVYIFSAIALFILMIACINFMNLSTARSASRAKEVGIRKVIGSVRSQLITQFLTESVIMSLFALLIAVILTELALPYFNNLAGKELVTNYSTNGILSISMVSLIIFIGLLAGGYPAFFLSSFKPVTGIKQNLTPGSSKRSMRSALVVFQFATSIALIIGTVVVYRQLNFVQNKKPGFEREQVLIINDAYILGAQIESFKNELLQNTDVVSATVSGYLPVSSDRTLDVMLPEGIYRESGSAIQKWFVDYDYIKTMGMEIVAGRDFSKSFATDSAAIVVNEAAVKHFSWDEPIGKHIGDYTAPPDAILVDFPVIGVVRDFHYESMRDHIGPLALFIGQSTNLVSLRLKTENLSQTIQWIQDKWNAFAPMQPIEYSFLDERFNAMYHAEQRIGNILGVFAALALFIGCLGLFGLAAFTAEQRTKEIGIRKVLGSSISGILLLLTKEFTKWIFIATLIASPVAYFLMSNWLQGFAYRTNIGILTFVVAGALTFAIAFLTVSYQAIKAANANPVDALKYE